MAFDVQKKHLTHSIENIEIYIVYRYSAKKYRDIVFCAYRAALQRISYLGLALISKQPKSGSSPVGCWQCLDLTGC